MQPIENEPKSVRELKWLVSKRECIAAKSSVWVKESLPNHGFASCVEEGQISVLFFVMCGDRLRSDQFSEAVRAASTALHRTAVWSKPARPGCVDASQSAARWPFRPGLRI